MEAIPITRSEPVLAFGHFNRGSSTMRKLIVGCLIVFFGCTSKETPQKVASTNSSSETVTAAQTTSSAPPPDAKTKQQKAISYATHPERFVKTTPKSEKVNITDPKTAQEHFNVGVEADNHKQWDKAIEAYQKALELKPDWALAHYRMAADYKLIGRTNDAVAHWEQATRYDPQFYLAYNRLASVYRSQGNLKKAIEAYTALLGYPPAKLGAHYQLGFAYAELGNRQQAREHLEAYRQLGLKSQEKESPRFQRAVLRLKQLEQ